MRAPCHVTQCKALAIAKIVHWQEVVTFVTLNGTLYLRESMALFLNKYSKTESENQKSEMIETFSYTYLQKVWL